VAITHVGHIIKMALQELEMLESGDNPEATEYTDGVDWLNLMISGWEADESLSLRPNLFTDDFDTVAGTASYTAGNSGTAFTYRPIRIVNAYLVSTGMSQPLGIQGKADYDLIQNKTVAGRPCVLYYDPLQVGVIYFDRVPDAVYTVFCDMQVHVGDYADENVTLAVSPEYRAALVYNLAVTLAPNYKANLRPQTASNAKRCLERIQYQAHIAQAVSPVPSCDLIV